MFNVISQLVRAWLVCTSCRSPIVSRAFELTLPVGGGKNSSKRITYTNPYPVNKKFHLLCDRNDLLQFKEPVSYFTIQIKWRTNLKRNNTSHK